MEERQNMAIIQSQELDAVCTRLQEGVSGLIDQIQSKAMAYVNAQASWLYWSIGRYITSELNYESYQAYGKQILATLSQTLSAKYGKGYTYTALTRMVKVAHCYDEPQNIELLMLNDSNIKVAQYLTELPDKQWFIDKLNKSILIAQETQY